MIGSNPTMMSATGIIFGRARSTAPSSTVPYESEAVGFSR
jgi:hypothetical protein